MRKYIVYLLLALFITTPLANVLAQGTNYRYTGQERDSASNLYYYGQRYYQPEVGRFTQPDPVSKYLTNPQRLKQATGQDLQEFLENPQKLNDYSYTINNPVKYTDPSGESVQLAWIVFSGLFLSNIETAHAPTLNSTPATLLQYKSIGDILPGLKDIPKGLRNGLAVMGAIVMPSSSDGRIASVLSRKIDSGLATSIIKSAKGGVVKLYKGVSSLEYEKIMEKGLNSLTHLTTDISEAMAYQVNKGFEPMLVEISVPLEKFVKMVSNDLLKKGSYGDEFIPIADSAIKSLNQYIKRN